MNRSLSPQPACAGSQAKPAHGFRQEPQAGLWFSPGIREDCAARLVGRRVREQHRRSSRMDEGTVRSLCAKRGTACGLPRSLSRAILSESHAGRDLSRAVCSSWRAVRNESHARWYLSRVVLSSCRAVRRESHAGRDLSHGVLSSCRTVRRESHAGWDLSCVEMSLCRTMQDESHAGWY